MDLEEVSESDMEIYRIQKEEEQYIFKLFSILQFCYTQALQPIKTLENYQDLQGYLQQISKIDYRLKYIALQRKIKKKHWKNNFIVL